MSRISSKKEMKLEKSKITSLKEANNILKNIGFKIISFKENEEILAKKGNKLGIRLIGGLLAPTSWFPIKAKIYFGESDEINHLLFIEVEEDFGIGSLKGVTSKYQKYCDDISNKLYSILETSI